MIETSAVLDRLKGEVAALTADLETKSRLAAVAGIVTRDGVASAARGLIEVREQLRLTRLALVEAERRHAAETAEANRALREADRDRCCDLTDDLEEAGKALVLSIKRAAKHYDRLQEVESAIRVAAASAADWPADWSWGALGEKRFALLVGALAANFTLPKIPPSAWPNAERAVRMSDPAQIYSALIQARESWRNPQNEPEAAAETEWREATAEEMTNAV